MVRFEERRLHFTTLLMAKKGDYFIFLICPEDQFLR